MAELEAFLAVVLSSGEFLRAVSEAYNRLKRRVLDGDRIILRIQKQGFLRQLPTP